MKRKNIKIFVCNLKKNFFAVVLSNVSAYIICLVYSTKDKLYYFYYNHKIESIN